MKDFFRNNREIILILLLGTLTGLAAQYLSYADEYVFAYRDSIYRLDASRRFIDAVNPGFFNQIGTVWLPLPNFIMFPLAAIDVLWKTGLAGSIVNYIAYLANCFAIFFTIKLVTRNKVAPWTGLLLFISNPNILYFQTTAMSEQLYLTFISLAVYFILKWNADDKNKYIWQAGLYSALASFTRYDGWTFTAAAALLILLISVFVKKEKFLSGVKYALPALAVIAYWCLHNYIYYSDPLEFIRGKFSTLYQLKFYETEGHLLTKHNLGLSAHVYYYDLLLYSGWLTLALSAAGIAVHIIKNKFRLRSLLLYLSVIAVPSTLLFLYAGQVIIELPQSFPDGYFNSRYGLYAVPGLVIFAAYFIDFAEGLLKSKRRYLAAGFLILLLFQIYSYSDEYPKNVPAIAEARYAGFKGSITYNLSKYFQNNYHGGNIFYDASVFALPPWSGVMMKERITWHTYEIGAKAMEHPEQYAQWVFFYKKEYDKIYTTFKDNPDFLKNYYLVYEEDGLQLFARK